MANYSEITADALKDNLFQEQLIQDILIQAQGYGNLNVPEVVKKVSVVGTDVKVPLMDAVAVTADLPELVGAEVKSPDFASISAKLLADEVKVAFSDEALASPNIKNPMELSIQDAAIGFARTLDAKIASALDTTPQTGTAINVTSKSPMLAAAEAAGKLGDYEMTAVVGGQTAIGTLMAGLTSASSRTAGYTVKDGMSYLDGYNVPIITSTSLEKKASGYIFFVSAKAPAAFVFEGQYKTRTYDAPEKRATIYQADVWNAVVGNVRQTSANLNVGVVKTQLTSQ